MTTSDRLRKALAALDSKREALQGTYYANPGAGSSPWATIQKIDAAKGRIVARLTELSAKREALRAAVKEMHREAGVTSCDIPWCSSHATGRWTRTAAELKGMRRKYRGATLEGAPVSERCAVHTPTWRSDVYRPIVAAVADERRVG